MKKTILIPSTFLLLTISLVMVPFMLFPAHAATGTVCIDARTTASCQTTTPNLISAVGTILTIHVNIQSSDALNAFDISILAPHDILQPSSANTTGTIVPNVQTVVNCIGGIGTGCTVSDTADTIHVAGVSLGQATASPTTGMLFVAAYNVISPGSLVIGFQTGCKGSSVTGTDTCLTIANGTPSPVAELAQTAFFSTYVTPTFAMSATPSSLGILEAASGSSKVTLTSINGFTGLVDLTATSTSTNVQPSLNPASVSLTPGQSASSNLTISVLNSTLPGTYTISVTGTGGTVANAVQVSVTVIPRQPSDFAITIAPLGRTVSQGNSASYSIVLRATAIPVRINMTASVYPVLQNGPIVSFNTSSVSVQPGSPAHVMMTVSTSATTPQTSYIILATGTTISIARSFTVQLTVGPPAPPPPPGLVCIAPSPATSCPSSPAQIIGIVGEQLTVSILIQGSTGINGFNLAIVADHNILKPHGVTVRGTVLPGPTTILAECIGGVSTGGSGCSLPDSVDTIHLALGSAPGTFTPTPVTGILFTATYDVLQSTAGTNIGFQTGCGPLTSSPPLCITMANGSMVPVPETAQAATVNAVATPDFTMTPSQLAIRILEQKTSSTIEIKAINGFNGTVTLSAVLTPGGFKNPAIMFQPSSIKLSSGQTGVTTLVVRANEHTLAGTYFLTVTASSGSITHAAVIMIIVSQPLMNLTQ